MEHNKPSIRSTGPTREINKSVSTYEEFETYVVIPPDGGFGWVIVIASFLCQFLTDGTMYTFGIFIKEISRSLNCTESQVTLSSSIQNSCYNISGPIVCALTNRFGFRPVCITGAILTALSYCASSFVQSVPYLIISHGFMAGIGFGMIYMPSIIIIGFYFDKWRALATSIIVTGSAVGTIAFPPLFNILLKDYSWRDKFRMISVMSLCLIICGATYRPIKQTRIARQTASTGVINRMTMHSIASTMTSSYAVAQIFSKSHNLAYPTAADVTRQGNFSLYDPSPESSEVLVSPSNAIMKTAGISFASRMPTSDFERLEMILEEDEDINKCQRCCLRLKLKCKCCPRKHQAAPFRPMYRDDVFFTGSVATLSRYSTQFRDKKPLEYHMSVTRVMTERDVIEEQIPCVCCPQAFKRPLATMFDCSLIRSPSFMTLTSSAFLSTLGVFVPYLYIIDAATHEAHIKHRLAVLLITVLGAANATGRLACGLLSFFPKIRPLEFSSVALFLAGVSTACWGASHSIIWQYSYVIIYGLGLAITSATRPLIIVELVGLQNLSNAFGLQTLSQGLACLIGIPLASYLLELTNTYVVPFCFAGTSIMSAGILLGVIRKLHKKERNL